MAFSPLARDALERARVVNQTSKRKTYRQIIRPSESQSLTSPFVLEPQDTFNLFFGPALTQNSLLLDYASTTIPSSHRTTFHHFLISNLAKKETSVDIDRCWKLKLKQPLGINRGPDPISQIWKCEIIIDDKEERRFQVVVKMYIKSTVNENEILQQKVEEIQQDGGNSLLQREEEDYYKFDWKEGINRVKREVRVFKDAKEGQGREIPYFYGDYHVQLDKNGRKEECLLLLMEFIEESAIPVARWMNWKGDKMTVIEFDEMLKAAFATQHFFEKNGIALGHNGLFDLLYYQYVKNHYIEPDYTVPLVAIGFGRVKFKEEILENRKTIVFYRPLKHEWYYFAQNSLVDIFCAYSQSRQAVRESKVIKDWEETEKY